MITKFKDAAFFQNFSDEEIIEISNISKYQNFNPGEIVFSELTPANSLFLLTKGHIHLIFDNKKIIDISQGQVFGDWAVVNNNMRLATAKATATTEVIEIDANAIKNFTINPKIAYKIVSQIANNLVSRLVVRSQIASHILIEEGETQFIEFKSSLRWNTHTNTKDADLELASIKTLAGFLNAKGGVLFIGVRDDGSILGIQNDNFENADKMMLHLNHLIASRLGKDATLQIHLSIVSLNNHLVLRAECDASHQPIYVKTDKDELFYVRVGNLTQSYSIKNAVEYIKERF
ncbi:putative DNA binding domain-containing protein [Flavobacterium plurextorum]|uniref:RNA-binding domain-containing protein n=1 Tax=Flavobacterium TaxID=237 RepID=UPI00214D2996|nr:MULTISPECIES: RNA-binding domain-containing protein [Flavobacterium]UUW08418.1 putative DNA binding domain-containing protein [Flavobacterium plurextorum]